MRPFTPRNPKVVGGIILLICALTSPGCSFTNAAHQSEYPTAQSTHRSHSDVQSTRTPEKNDTWPQSEEELIAEKLIDSGGQFAASESACGDILTFEPWCVVIKSVDRISRPEWDQLFPATAFYIVRTVIYGGEVPFRRNMLLVPHDGDRYGPVSFHQLLEANGVEVSEENYEAIAKSHVLMMLPDFIEYEVRFLDWEEGDWPSTIRKNFNYRMAIWTELGGFEFQKS